MHLLPPPLPKPDTLLSRIPVYRALKQVVVKLSVQATCSPGPDPTEYTIDITGRLTVGDSVIGPGDSGGSSNGTERTRTQDGN